MALKIPSAFSTTKSTYERSRRTLASSCGPKCNDPSHGHRQKTVTRSMTKADALNNALETKTVENLQHTVDVYDAEKDKEKLEDFRHQSENPASQLDYVTWLKFAAPTYNICPHIEGYIIVNTLVCPSDIPNRNGIAFPAKELARFLPPPTNRMAYKAWTGCPVHCFPGDTKIRTRDGLRRLDEIRLGDEVLTHKQRFKKVTHLFDNGVQRLHRINCYGITMPILATANHPMWVVDRRQVFSGQEIDGRVVKGRKSKSHKELTIKPHFRPVSDIYPLDYLVVPIALGGDVEVRPEFAFLTGLYAAEGNLYPSNTSKKFTSTRFTLGYAEKELLEKAISCAEALGLDYVYGHQKAAGTATLDIRSPDFAQAMFDLVGVYSHQKKLKGELRKWDKVSLAWFLGGYISGDGSVKGNYRLRCRTASEELAQDLQMVFGRLGIPASANNDGGWTSMFTDKYKTRKGTRRKGRGGKPFNPDTTSFCVGATLEECRVLKPYLTGRKFVFRQKKKDLGPKILVFNNHILLPISSIEKADKEPVFNIEVEDDNSYVAGGVVVHNCEHDNEVHERAYGVILDSAMTKIQGYGGGKLWKVMGLLAIDKDKHPDIAQKVLTKEINTYSMGAMVDYFTCGYCGTECNSQHVCSHITSTKNVNWKEVRDYDGSSHLVFLNAHNIQPIECSIVADPAWAPALSDESWDFATGAPPSSLEKASSGGDFGSAPPQKFL